MRGIKNRLGFAAFKAPKTQKRYIYMKNGWKFGMIFTHTLHRVGQRDGPRLY